MLVVAERMSAEFSGAFHAFLSAGEYSCYFSKDGKPHFYRFLQPKTEGYPEMIELLIILTHKMISKGFKSC